MRSLVSNIVTEDYVIYAELARRRPPAHPDVLRHAQRAGAAGDRPRAVARRASSTARSSQSRSSAIRASARCWSTPSMPAITASSSASRAVSILAVVTVRSSSSTCCIRCSIRACRWLSRCSRSSAISSATTSSSRIGVLLFGSCSRSQRCPSSRPIRREVYVVPPDLPPRWAYLVRHELARAGRFLAAHLRHPQHPALRPHRGAHQPHHLARVGLARRLCRRLRSTAC